MKTNCPDFKLYLILDYHLQMKHPPLALARMGMENGVDLLQLRYKGSNIEDFYQLAVDLRKLTTDFGIPLIINDRVDIALAAGADGVHLGQQDLPQASARKLLGPNKIIGRTGHSLEQALAAQTQGADYVSCGPIFQTFSKADAHPPAGLELIREYKRQIEIPWVCIGGITAANLPQITAAGATRIAVISAISQANDPASAAGQLRNILLILLL